MNRKVYENQSNRLKPRLSHLVLSKAVLESSFRGLCCHWMIYCGFNRIWATESYGSPWRLIPSDLVGWGLQ